MEKKTNVFIATPPEFAKLAIKTGVPVAHLSYKIGRGVHLYRANIPLSIRGGLMVVDTDGFSGGGPISALVSEIISECKRFSFTGIVIDSNGKSSPLLRSLIAHLASYTKRNDLKLFVPEILGDVDASTIVIISSAISGGTLTQLIEEFGNRYGRHRLALEIEKICMDFILPSKNGGGMRLPQSVFDDLIETHHAKSFFSQELCTYYFFYKNKNQAHFVLYDNSASIRHKLFIAEETGIGYTFLLYPQIADQIGEIIKK